MQFSYISALLATLALTNAAALPQPDAVALVPADIVNDLEVRDPQGGIGLGLGVGVDVGVSVNVDAEFAFVQKTCGPVCGTCQSYLTCFSNVCSQQGYSWQTISSLRSRLQLSASVQIGLSAGLDLDFYKQKITGACPSLGYQCFINYCSSQGYSQELISTLQISLNIAVSASGSISN